MSEEVGNLPSDSNEEIATKASEEHPSADGSQLTVGQQGHPNKKDGQDTSTVESTCPPDEPTRTEVDKGLASTVATHYNSIPEAGRAKRVQSRIYFQRNFNNWIKSMCISDALNRLRENDKRRKIVVLDLCCGKGGDVLKWKIGDINHLVCADIAAVSIEQCEQRYRRSCSRSFSAEFHTADCSKQVLTDLYKDSQMTFDLTSCQFSFHYSFESVRQADTMLRNACDRLKPGGLFVGTMPNSCELVRRVQTSKDLSFGNDVYRVSFKNKDEFPLFGCIYDFHLEGVVDCPEFLVYFPVLEKMAKKYNMRLLYCNTFAEFFKKHSGDKDNQSLLGRMQALEVYPSSKDGLSETPGDYDHAKEYVEKLKSGSESERGVVSVGTLSRSEWEATSLYLVFAFVKMDGADGSPERQDVDREEEKKEVPQEKDAEPTLECPPNEDALAAAELEAIDTAVVEEGSSQKKPKMS